MRASAIPAAGIVLSHPTTQTTASKSCPRQTSSMESAITSRLTREAFMPSVPIVSPSLIAMVLNSMGVPPAARMPSFTFADNRRRWKLQGMVSIQVLATPIRGLLRSSSVNPTALNMERAPARERPSVILRLRCLRSIGLEITQRVAKEEVQTSQVIGGVIRCSQVSVQRANANLGHQSAMLRVHHFLLSFLRWLGLLGIFSRQP